MTLAEHVLSATAQFHGIAEEEILGRSRVAKTNMARQFVAYLCFDELKMSKSDIGRMLNRDHSSVCSALDAITTHMNDGLSGQIEMVRNNAIHRRHAELTLASIRPAPRNTAAQALQ